MNAAQVAAPTSGFNSLLTQIESAIIYPLIGLAFAVAMVYFLVGVVKFIQNADNPDKRSEGQKHILWGIVGMAVMVSALGIIQIIQATVNKL